MDEGDRFQERQGRPERVSPCLLRGKECKGVRERGCRGMRERERQREVMIAEVEVFLKGRSVFPCSSSVARTSITRVFFSVFFLALTTFNVVTSFFISLLQRAATFMGRFASRHAKEKHRKFSCIDPVFN